MDDNPTSDGSSAIDGVLEGGAIIGAIVDRPCPYGYSRGGVEAQGDRGGGPDGSDVRHHGGRGGSRSEDGNLLADVCIHEPIDARVADEIG